MKPLGEATNASSHEKEAALHLLEIDILWNFLYHSAVSWDTVIMKLNYLTVQQHRHGLNEFE